LSEGHDALSPGWPRTVAIELLLDLAWLATITMHAYRNAPPIPAKVVDERVSRSYSGDDNRAGQAVFRNCLMATAASGVTVPISAPTTLPRRSIAWASTPARRSRTSGTGKPGQR